MVSNLGSDKFEELVADVWREDRAALLFDGCRLLDPDLTLVVVVDQGVVGKGKIEGGPQRGAHRL